MIGRYNRRRFLLYGSAIGTSVLLKACGGNSTPSAANPDASPAASPAAEASKDFKMAIVLPGVITDGGWNQSGYEGVNTAKQRLGAEMAYVEKVAQPEQTEALSDFARQGYNLVIGHGGQFDAAIQQVASQFPQTFFLAVNGNVAGSNYASVQTNYLQLCYLCGILAGLMTKSNRIAYITGLSFKGTELQFRGFELGAKSVKPKINVVSSFTGDFNDIAKGKEAALALIATGVDVLLHNLDNSAPAVLEMAAQKGIYALGNTKDQFDIAPKAVLTSAVQDIGLAIAYVAELASKNQIKGEKYVLGLEQPEIAHLGRFNPVVPAKVKQKVDNVKGAMLANKLSFEDCKLNDKDTICVQGAA